MVGVKTSTLKLVHLQHFYTIATIHAVMAKVAADKGSSTRGVITAVLITMKFYHGTSRRARGCTCLEPLFRLLSSLECVLSL